MFVRSFWISEAVDAEVITDKSMTIPDQSLSVRDIIMRYRRGDMQLSPIETGDDDNIDGDDYEFEDMVDAQEYYERGMSVVDELRAVNSQVPDPGDVATPPDYSSSTPPGD